MHALVKTESKMPIEERVVKIESDVEYMKGVIQKIDNRVEEIKADIESFKTEMTKELASFKTEMAKELGSFKTEVAKDSGSVRTEIANVRTEISRLQVRMIYMHVATTAGILLAMAHGFKWF
jgi:archaellum component FlaC